jgi:hypothetical protein
VDVPVKCRHPRHADEVCLDCGVKVGTCPHAPCSKTVALDADGYISYHDFPEPCRAVCPGAKYSSVEAVARG